MYIIDRFEGDYAIIEGHSRESLLLPKELMPEALEGDVIIISVQVDRKETEKRKKEAKKLLDGFFDE